MAKPLHELILTRLEEHRKIDGEDSWRVEDVAREIGVHPTNLYRFIKGDSAMRSNHLEEAFRVLGLKVIRTKVN